MSSLLEPLPGEVEDGFEVRPFTEECRRLLVPGEHALIGISVGNSYFSQHRLARLLRWAQRRFAAIDIVYVDLHLEAMYIASGCDREHAAPRATRAIRDARRRVRRAVELAAPSTDRVRVRPLSECTDLPGYQKVARSIDQEVATDPRVRQACEEHVRSLLGSRPDPDGDRLRAGLAYLRAELPFIVNTPDVLGTSSSLGCYHTLLPVLPRLHSIASCFHPRQGHLVVRPADAERPPPIRSRTTDRGAAAYPQEMVD